MAAIMSPNAPKNELAGMERAEEFFNAPCRKCYSSRLIISFCEQLYMRLAKVGQYEYAEGFRRMGYIIAQQRGV